MAGTAWAGVWKGWYNCLAGGEVATRREVLKSTAAALVIAGTPVATRAEGIPMYGLIGSMKAVPGQRDALVRILLEGIGGMPGCLSYVVAEDPADPDSIWITEVWDSAESHKASLALPSVREAITRAKPLIGGFGQHTETRPVGGHGLPPA
jgi:quinol monooxygenase YgiN